MIPDLGIVERPEAGGIATLVAIAAPPLTGQVNLEFPTRYHRIEIRTVGGETLVTAIELLSPAHKRPGAEGAEMYERKRREVFRSDAHLLEIDLLRGGQRPDAGIVLPDEPYFVFLSRAQYRPRISIWPMPLRAALPVVAVPLLPPDADLPLDLTQRCSAFTQRRATICGSIIGNRHRRLRWGRERRRGCAGLPHPPPISDVWTIRPTVMAWYDRCQLSPEARSRPWGGSLD